MNPSTKNQINNKHFLILFMFFLSVVLLNSYISSVYPLIALLMLGCFYLFCKNQYRFHYLVFAWLINIVYIMVRTVTWNQDNIKINLSFVIGFLFFWVMYRQKIELSIIFNRYIKFFAIAIGMLSPLIQLLLPGLSAWSSEETVGFLGRTHYVVMVAFLGVAYCFFCMTKHPLVKTMVSLLAIVVVMLSGSRSNLITIPFSIGLVYLIDSARGETIKRIFKILLILIIVVVLFFIIGNYFQFRTFIRIQESIERYTRGLDISNGRSGLQEMAWRDFKSEPIWGIGWMNFSDYHIGEHYENYNVHNFYLQLLCELGITGAILILFPMLWMLISDISFVRKTPFIEAKKKIRISLAYQISPR